MTSKQPTAMAFTRTQESWSDFVLEKVRAKIDEREAYLQNELGWRQDEFSNDDGLLDLYDEELFYERYSKEMREQRAYLRKKFFGEDTER